MTALIVTALILALGLAGPADGLRVRVNRAVYRVVGFATPLAVGALLANLGVIGGAA